MANAAFLASPAFTGIVGRAPCIVETLAMANRAARTDCTVLLVGDSGTGKELVAQAIERASPRHGGPFIVVNMAAVPETLVESELFGHVAGAFTGAQAAREGRFEAADGGTIFIDEIGDFPLNCQAKLLRFLESNKVVRVGANRERTVDVRVIAATNRDLTDMLAERTFRADLYYRLNVVQIRLPTLRERASDIPLLADYFLNDLGRKYGRKDVRLDAALLDHLMAFDWPGNVRELRHCIETLLVMSDATELTVNDLAAEYFEPRRVAPLRIEPGLTLAELERRAIEITLDRHGGSRTLAAKSLGISTRTLTRRLKKWRDASPGPGAPLRRSRPV